MPISFKDTIKSISYDQNEIMYNILKLYNNGEDFECDPTYSKGGYYSKSDEFQLNPPKYKFDVYPIVDDVIKIEPLGRFPLDDNSIKSINVDLPFTCSIGPSLDIPQDPLNINNVIVRRFQGYYPITKLFESYYHFLFESFRVLVDGGICCWKCQRTISGGITYMTPEMSWLFAEKLGFHTIDRFTLVANKRLISGKVKNQEHSRSFDSQFYVFKKPDGKRRTKVINYFNF